MNNELSRLQETGRNGYTLDNRQVLHGDQIALYLEEVWKDGIIIEDVWMEGRALWDGCHWYFKAPFWPRSIHLVQGMTARWTEVAGCTCGAKFYGSTAGIDDHDCPFDHQEDDDA